MATDQGAKRLVVTGNFEGMSSEARPRSFKPLHCPSFETPLIGARRLHRFVPLLTRKKTETDRSNSLWPLSEGRGQTAARAGASSPTY